MLLTPGVFLRLGENSSIKMLDTRLVSTRVDVLSGNVILESWTTRSSAMSGDSPVVVLYKGYEIRMQKHGLVELSSNPGQLKVFKGEALVELAAATGVNNRAVVKEGKALPFSAALLTEKFDDKVGDELYLWARDRSQVLSAANMSSARSLSSAGGYGSLVGLRLWDGRARFGHGRMERWLVLQPVHEHVHVCTHVRHAHEPVRIRLLQPRNDLRILLAFDLLVWRRRSRWRECRWQADRKRFGSHNFETRADRAVAQQQYRQADGDGFADARHRGRRPAGL